MPITGFLSGLRPKILIDREHTDGIVLGYGQNDGAVIQPELILL